MVKNSKHLIYLLGLVVSINAQAQLQQNGLSPIKRDLEITRVTFENFLKHYDDALLLNNIKESEGDYKDGKGVEIQFEAYNANIYINTAARFGNNDNEILDTFYTDEIISLQQKRLEEATKKFIKDFHSYLPQLKPNEEFKFVFNIEDSKIKVDGKELPPSPKSAKRTYKLEAVWKMRDIDAFSKGEINESQLSDRIKIEKK
ncbi:hypothetical protein [Roseivirga sp.]|uniref:hypothetical protein n=1 Tax=Roseivirga sp. TaxID=1964215 RepID=UPI002B273E80|nr:hypothetical protein [Roseivirga sp.]